MTNKNLSHKGYYGLIQIKISQKKKLRAELGGLTNTEPPRVLSHGIRTHYLPGIYV